MRTWRKIIAAILGWKVVYLLDFDGEVVCRLARPTPFGASAWRMSRTFRVAHVRLLPDGTVQGASYVREWADA